jgi:ABC-type dipeptide/oligopeptide/nickel transport system ATPase subunit
MKILQNEMDEKKTEKIKEIIQNTYDSLNKRGEIADNIKEKMKEAFPKIKWSVIIYVIGSANVAFNDNDFFFLCIMKNKDGNEDRIIVSGLI